MTQIFAIERYVAPPASATELALRYVVDGAQRMHGMIGNILLYARAGRQVPAPVPVDMAHALAEALKNLQGAIEESGARIEHGALPRVLGDEVRITQLWQNLVDNAIKFRGAAAPVVRIAAAPSALHWHFSITDNGIGIPRDARYRLFRLFQRLHADDRYAGSGVGLALCKRIVESHGGRIWFDSEPGHGSTFHFTWPRTDA